ncbi:MAG: DUF1156 domain-containing protein [Blastocatellales bacterium]|nr:DUF1156 domain-containing protein [Blastocatellales bacterium]
MQSHKPRLIEVAFPLKQTSIDSVHEKNVRHGHISTLHIWPARRPLAACRAALIATLLPDPGDAEERRQLLERLAGRVVKVSKKKTKNGRTEESIVEETVGGILHWGRESGPDLEWFRQKIREAYGGRAPKVLDPFAGGGAIPLEAMRLGCEVTANDLNPVAWFILKCTLEYPQRLAGQVRPLPKFALESLEFMENFFKGTGKPTKKQLAKSLEAIQQKLFPPPAVDLSWHVRAWGWWVLQRAKADLERFYPVVEGKPTVAYLWARTVACKNCRALVPLLKTRWLCKKNNKRVLLTMEPKVDRTGVCFGVHVDPPMVGSNSAQKREHDRRISTGTMSRSGASCPCCSAIMTMEDIRLEGRAGRLGATMTAVVVDGEDGKEYRPPTETEIRVAVDAQSELGRIFVDVPFGLPQEPTPKGGNGASRAFSVDGYGFDQWQKLFTPRQLLALGTIIRHTRNAREVLYAEGYPPDWIEAIAAYLVAMFDRLANQGSNMARWNQGGEKIEGTFARFALPILWDFAEVNPLGNTSGGYSSAFEWVTLATAHLSLASLGSPTPKASQQSAIGQQYDGIDVVVTDPPYYDAIPYSDLMDFFYVWMRRSLQGISPAIDAAFHAPLAPKWDHEHQDGELIDDASRHEGNKAQSKAVYEDGMFRAFQSCHQALDGDGRLVIVFAHKHPDAWETLVSAIIRAGFVVDGSWPIQTERQARTRSLSSAALSSSVWLVCKKRPETARAGWDNRVLEEMRAKIARRLRDFWDAGIRGPDFVWAATGPALEAYSQHPVVKKANAPGELMSVTDFLRHVRRMVVDFVVGRVLSQHGAAEDVTGLDDVTTYYLLHRHDFGMDDAPSGACILYAVSCGLSDSALADQFDILIRSGGQSDADDAEDGDENVEDVGADEVDDAAMEEGKGSKVKLRTWHQRKRKGMGFEAVGDRPIALIDQIHRLMHIWRAGDVMQVDEYIDACGLRRNALFHQILQALIELSTGEERSLLESISNHVAALGAATAPHPTLAFDG